MSKAVQKAADLVDDEIGAADGAASLGMDGGPMVSSVTYDDENLEDFEDDEVDGEGWLDEELSDEELAALGEEDFADDEFVDDDLDYADADDFSAPSSEDGFDDAELTGFDDAAEARERPANDAGALVAAGALVTAGQTPPGSVGGFDDGEMEDLGDGKDDYRPVPRISVHAFCETVETTALLESAAVDRRLSKAHLTMHMGGIAKAIDHFQTTPTPNLVILETIDGGARLLGQLGELAQVCDPSTKVVIIGRVNDVALYRELMRQGISEYIIRPRNPLQLIRSISALYVDPSAPPIGKTLAFVGARGGAGSSTIAHNVAWCAAEEYLSDTVIVDLDLPFGTASLDFEQDPTSGLVEALSAPERLDDVLLDRLLQKHTDRLSLFTAPNLLDRDYDLDEQAFETVIDVVRGSAPTIVIDVPHLWTNWAKRLLQTADEIVITATPDLAGFRNTKNLVDVISGARPNDAPPHLVINQFDPKMSSVQPEQYVEHVGLEPVATFGWEPQLFHTAATNAAPIVEVGPKTKTAQSIRQLAQTILGRRDEIDVKSKFNLKDLFKLK
ncbi:MAG: CpaE family protein [Parvularculaceae bacterium]